MGDTLTKEPCAECGERPMLGDVGEPKAMRHIRLCRDCYDAECRRAIDSCMKTTPKEWRR